MPAKITQDEYIIRVNQKHNNKYNYDKVVYVNSRTNITIICPVHGEFQQTAGRHLAAGCRACGYDEASKKLGKEKETFVSKSKSIFGNVYTYDKVQEKLSNNSMVVITCPKHGDFKKRVSDHLFKKRGCNYCNNIHTPHKAPITQNTEHFISKANKKHNFKYTYEKVNYVNSQTKVLITCPEHGDFEQSPGNHLHGFKCSKCTGNYRYNNLEYIEKCKEVHKDKYNYDKTKYTSSTQNILITCPEHGNFEQIASIHLRGGGCPNCGGTKKLNRDEFIKRSVEIHGNAYIYDMVDYKNLKSKVKIICKEHGVFEQKPSHHIHNANGCPRCYGVVKLTTEEFVNKASKIHNNKYNYTNTKYVSAHTDVIIECNDHGEFKITPNAHANGSGCPVCSKHNQQFAYIHMVYDGSLPIALKYGIEKVKGRRHKLQNNKSIYTVVPSICYYFDTSNDCRSAEKECKKVLKKGLLTKNEMPDGYTETTSITNIDKIISIYEKWNGKREK